MATQTPIFGIDLGTTNSCIAYVDEFGKASVVPNTEGDLTTPSIVLFETATNIIVGKEAFNSAVAKPNNVVVMVKREMGSGHWRFIFEGKEYSPEEISAYILRKIVSDAEQSVGHPITDVIITCPAYFGLPEREATASAGKIAGLNVIEVINEPVAAAINLGMQEQRDQVVLVYDLGGGTFDVTMIVIKNGSIYEIATGGDHYLGGRNWDEQIVLYIAQEWMTATGATENPMDAPDSLQELWIKAELAKKSLSRLEETTISLSHAGHMGSVKLTRAKFDELTAALLERTIAYTKDTLTIAAQAGHPTFDQLILVGGSTKMVQVKNRLIREFAVEPKSPDPDQAVAKGAAIYGQKLAVGQRIVFAVAKLTGTNVENVDLTQVPVHILDRATTAVGAETGLSAVKVREMQQQQIINILSHSFGILVIDETTGTAVDAISNIVMRNEVLPKKATSRYGTLRANQAEVLIQIFENDIMEEYFTDVGLGKEVGQATLSLPPNLPANAPIDVTFDANQQGRLHMTAIELSSNQMVETTITFEGSITAAEELAASNRLKLATIN